MKLPKQLPQRPQPKCKLLLMLLRHSRPRRLLPMLKLLLMQPLLPLPNKLV